jgi:tetratricopeptide (TPR) repeat protein
MLREWYMSQFFPITAIADFERSLGLLRPEEIPTTDTEARRYFVFCETEPDSPLGYAAAAHWSARSGEPQAGLKILDEGRAKLAGEPSHPFWLSAVIQCSIDVGDARQARAALDRWPAEDRGHSYWRSRALVLDETGQYRDALAAYDAALTIWPGPVDWRLQFRKANCLGRAGLHGEAADERTAAKVIEDLNQDPVHSRLRELMAELEQPDTHREIAEFYTKINRRKEAQHWLLLTQRSSALTEADAATELRLPSPERGAD